MKKLFLGLFVSTLLTPLLIFAQPTRYVKLGINYSSFRTEGGRSEPGLTFGVGKDFYLIRSFKGFWGFGVDYARKKVTLENKVTPTSFDPKYSDVVIEDIKANIAYMDILFSVGYVPLEKSGKYSLRAFGGFTISLPIKNHTELNEKKIIFLGPDEWGKYEFDYVIGSYESINPSTNLLTGISFNYKSFILYINLSRALSSTRGFTNLSVRDRIDSFCVAMAYAF